MQQEKLSKKEQKKKELEELTAIFKPVEQKIGKGLSAGIRGSDH